MSMSENLTLSQPGEVNVAAYLSDIWRALNGDPDDLGALSLVGEGVLPSLFNVTDLASAAIGAVGLAIAELVRQAGGAPPVVEVNRRHASQWFGVSLRPQGWALPPTWDAVAGDYPTADGWIRLHTNAPHHRDAALAVLGVAPEREAVARAVARWQGDALEQAVLDQYGCAAVMRTQEAWARHPQGIAVRAEPLLIHDAVEVDGRRPDWTAPAARPLQGVRVLDLTRVLAGPVATRALAGFGAQVLRIDPLFWDEPNVVPDVVLGKRCARVDLKSADGRALLRRLIGEADVMVHGYRPTALAGLGFDADERRRINPSLIDVSLDAYGWSGAWQGRRGFDSLVQMSTGIAETGMREKGADRPVPLPVQALDHGTGYLMAAAVVRALVRRLATGRGSRVRASLARTAALLVSTGLQSQERPLLAPGVPADLAAGIEATSWGDARRIVSPLAVSGAPMQWAYPARELGWSPATW
ncbi:CoA transferase [Burkholderia sp. FERM BP-3421]|uniref:CoA transferase n=1 Tax=Burkholderia sp. FERM BP-3421 TaxID=1494466 RepID=UPI003FCC8FC9